ncbi:MAG: hypothetical protein GY953_29510, partial [bacterium]|nr:hypothetical protein [bacterium]
DLRAAHLLGIHGLQIIPLIGYALSRARLPLSGQGALLGLAAAAYIGIGYAIFRQALDGIPLVRM